jgi:hypothetical protein
LKDWETGIVGGILFEKGVLNNEPLVTHVTQIFSQFPEGV